MGGGNCCCQRGLWGGLWEWGRAGRRVGDISSSCCCGKVVMMVVVVVYSREVCHHFAEKE